MACPQPHAQSFVLHVANLPISMDSSEMGNNNDASGVWGDDVTYD